MRNRVDSDDNGGDGDGEKQLNTDDRIDFANERPAELRALQHHRVERLAA